MAAKRKIRKGAVRYLPGGVFMQMHCDGCGGRWWHQASRSRKVSCGGCGAEAVMTSVGLREDPPRMGCFGNCAR